MVITDGPMFTHASLTLVELFYTGEATWDMDETNDVGGDAINCP